MPHLPPGIEIAVADSAMPRRPAAIDLTSYLAAIAQMNSAHASVDETVRT
jgi:hypothetical protein